jgi:hypothetical protein
MLTQPRSVCVVLAAVAWAATAAAVIAGGDLGRGAAVQIVLAASMATAALSDALLSPALSPAGQATVSHPGPAGAARWRNWSGAVAVIAVLLGPAAGAVFGAGWRTSLFTTLALACAAASIVAYRPGRLLPRGASRTRAHATAVDPRQLQGSDLASPREFVAM